MARQRVQNMVARSRGLLAESISIGEKRESFVAQITAMASKYCCKCSKRNVVSVSPLPDSAIHLSPKPGETRRSVNAKLKRAGTINAAESLAEESKYILLPDGWLRYWWDLLITILVIYYAIIVPAQMVYPRITDNPFFDKFDSFGTAIFVIDILFSFNTAFFVEGFLITQRRIIAAEYMRFWFIVDLVSVIPFESFGEVNSASAGDAAVSPFQYLQRTRVTASNNIVNELAPFPSMCTDWECCNRARQSSQS